MTARLERSGDDDRELRSVDRGVFVGLTALDFGYLVQRYPVEDTKNTAEDQFTAAGGPATNAAVTFAFLARGGTHLMTALGAHFLTEFVRDDLRQHAVQVTDLTPERAEPPPISSITIARENGSRTVVSLDASRLVVPASALPDGLLHDVGVVLLDGHLPELCVAVARAAREAGVPVVFDGGRWKKINDVLLEYVDIAICSRSFHPPAAVDHGRHAVHEYLHARGVDLVATTDGAAPIRFSTPTAQGEVAVPQTAAIDTLGAGDIFHGAFCYYFLRSNGRFREALENAALVASTSCAHFGTRAWMAANGRARFPG
ncbi:MAG: PfkB family carbohydrate kinase [Egibacteraceae bacterium]